MGNNKAGNGGNGDKGSSSNNSGAQKPDNQSSGGQPSGPFHKGGYQPVERRGYSPDANNKPVSPAANVPKPPVTGGTATSPKPADSGKGSE